ncbi:Hypothetical predicted protein [Paramuricea clavata]|uniref:Uncharacterized protein n=1 Tax=Paramuricea clavata TaxID=317549 RepID=A0A6S7GX20_PARCT|nr:Hypothetical predicted protein [Paramuricea clavata]
MNLRQQVIFSSQTVNSTVKYEPSLAHSCCRDWVATRIHPSQITPPRSLRSQLSMTEELMDRVNLAVSAETERQNKMGVLGKKSLHVNQIDNSPDSGQESQNPNMREKIGNEEKECKSNKLVAAMEAVQSDLASLKEAFNKSQISGKDASKQNQDQRSQYKRKSSLCKKCQESVVKKCQEKHWGEHKSLLRTLLPEDRKSEWKDSEKKVVRAYNCTVNDATVYLPFLLFGRPPRLPVDLMFGTSPTASKGNHTEYVKRWKGAIKDVYAKAISNASKAASAGKSNYNRKVRFTVLDTGDCVPVRNLTERGGPGKLRSYWENQIYQVLEQKGELPIFVVKPEGGANGQSGVHHRNLLLSCDFLPPYAPGNVHPVARQQQLEKNKLRTTEQHPCI